MASDAELIGAVVLARNGRDKRHPYYSAELHALLQNTALTPIPCGGPPDPRSSGYYEEKVNAVSAEYFRVNGIGGHDVGMIIENDSRAHDVIVADLFKIFEAGAVPGFTVTTIEVLRSDPYIPGTSNLRVEGLGFPRAPAQRR